jgi:PAS domain S-box-containing protein
MSKDQFIKSNLNESCSALTNTNEWEQTFDALPDLIAIIDVDHCIKKVNKAMADRLNGNPEDFIGNKCYSLIHATDQPPNFCPNSDLIEDEIPHKREFPFERLEGDFIVSVSPIFDNNGQLTGFIHVARDITVKKKLEESSRRLAAIVESSEDAIIGKDLNGMITSWNYAAQKIYGYSPEEILGKSISILIPIYFKDDLDQIMEKIKKGESIKRFDTIRRKKDGTLIDVSLSISPILDYGDIIGASIIAHDITERKIIEENLNKRNAEIEAIFSSMNDAIVIMDKNGNFFMINEAAVKFHRFESKDEFLRKLPDYYNLFELSSLDGNILDIDEWPAGRALRGETLNNFEVILKRTDTKESWIGSYNSSIVYNEKNELDFIVFIIQNITERKNAELALKESEEKYREVFNNANDAMFLNKITENSNPGKFLEVNDVASNILGYTREELLHMGPEDIDSQDTIDGIPEIMHKLFNDGKATFEAIQITKEGKKLPFEISAHVFTIKEQKYILSISRDIRDRKKAEKALKYSELKYRKIFENIQDIFYQTDNHGIITEISPSIERYSGYKPIELIGKSIEIAYFNPEDRTDLMNEVKKNGEVVDYELRLKNKNGRLLYVSVNSHILFDLNNNPIGIEGSLRDISERKNIEIKLQKSLEEKEMLLKEIHHRVKNNLMIISSLLNLQSRYIKDKTSKNIFKESQNRAMSMALIHERLYQSTDLKSIDFGDYIKTLSTDLYRTYVPDTTLIKLNLNLENEMVDIDTTVPLGLIINELITNSLKHAFTDGHKGEINIEFYKQNNEFILIVNDNGIGFPEDIDFRNSDSLGLRLVNTLVVQIDGEITLDNSKGTQFKIIFKEIRI